MSDLLTTMAKRISAPLCIAAALLTGACSNPADSEDIPTESGAGTCVPIMVSEEFIFLSWYELIDINNDNMLDQFNDPSTKWRMRKLAEAGFNVYFDYRLNSILIFNFQFITQAIADARRSAIAAHDAQSATDVAVDGGGLAYEGAAQDLV